MRKRYLVLFLLMGLSVLLSGCMSLLAEIISGGGTGTNEAIQGTVVKIETLTMNTGTALLFSELAQGEKVLVAISPKDEATGGEGVIYKLRVGLEEGTDLSTQSDSGNIRLPGELPGVKLLPAEEVSMTPNPAPGQMVGDEVAWSGGSTDYRVYQGEFEEAERSIDPLAETGYFYVYDYDAENYYTVNASLLKTGTKIEIYLDEQSVGKVTDDQLNKIKSEFDNAIYSRVTSTFGSPWDRNGDGKVTLLITPMVYDGSTTDLVGYFDEINYSTGTYSNRCDMFYLNANVVANGQLTSVYSNLAHEFQHMVFFSEKYWAKRPTLSISELWVNEGFSVLASHLSGYLNLANDSRVYDSVQGYFAKPNKDGLTTWESGRVVSNYGSTGLFAYYLYERDHGAIKDISTSGSSTSEAIRQSIGLSFDEIFRNWMTANIVDRLQGVSESRYRYSGITLKGFPAYKKLSTSGETAEFSGRGVQYYLIEGKDLDVRFSLSDYYGSSFPTMNVSVIFLRN